MGWLQFTPSQYYLLTIQDGDTALILAAKEGHTLTVKALTRGGADPNIHSRVSGSHCSTTGLCSNVCYCNHSMSISYCSLYSLLLETLYYCISLYFTKSYVYYEIYVHLCPHVSSSPNGCGCTVDGGGIMAAI